MSCNTCQHCAISTEDFCIMQAVKSYKYVNTCRKKCYLQLGIEKGSIYLWMQNILNTTALSNL